ncbi:phage tail sheath subtilisin-like domain-containing protein [Streptomyces sp. NBC_01408]|uniref:phage tail sheath family protein n=1 Tax=Streptomyces sp. NBC_01408 TaxID=2903855 RepID=UPI00224D1C3A|nr:phage tail sheath subtilisin-like domain-containing protein [Streptomyces sp. NBC_01408]MCX4695772.1 phage tail sheath subtilisin-like domain-containing protein [Streptomyces sp. NBC_01408]
MPEYLTPGVYVEETSFRSRSVEGVPTSTFGMTGRTEYGPVPYSLPAPADPTVLPGATLVTSFTEYERAFGGLKIGDTECQLALAARAFFANGGRRLYVARVFAFTRSTGATPAIDVPRNFASLAFPASGNPLLRWRARWPGSAGARISVGVTFRRGKNILVPDGGAGAPPRLTGVRPGAAVEVAALAADGRAPVLGDETPPQQGNVRFVVRGADGVLGYGKPDGSFEPVTPGTAAFHLTLAVTVRLGDRVDVYNELELGQEHPRAVSRVLDAVDPADEFSLVWLQTVRPATGQPPVAAGALLAALLGAGRGAFLTGGGDGEPLTAQDLLGQAANPDSLADPARGLGALGEVDDIAIVAVPDTVDLSDGEQKTAVDHLIAHCERLRYRMAVVDPPRNSSPSEVRRFRAQFDTKYAALYYPWVRITDPSLRPDPGAPAPLLEVPPSGYVAGVYARSDIERGVHKAPANEVLLGINDFSTNVTYDRQSVLNPEGINALRFFEGRARRVWGARTMSSDPEWKYVNVRRLFIYLEHSIDKSTQWAVFEPNNERLWASVRQTIEDFLIATWRTGALMGTKPEEAFFVRCDRTTMTQNDLDNGRLICLIGVAPTYPAEFVVFRIGQFTADAQRG